MILIIFDFFPGDEGRTPTCEGYIVLAAYMPQKKTIRTVPPRCYDGKQMG